MSETLARPLADRLGSLPIPRDPHEGTATPQSAVAGAVQALDDGKTKYTNRPGIVPLREWVANHVIATYRVGMTANDITITCGIAEAEYVTLAYFTSQRPGKILIADHTDDDIYVDRVRPLAHLLGTDVLRYEVDSQSLMGRIMSGERDPQPEPDDFIEPDGEIALAYIGEDGAKSTALLHYALEHDLPVVWSTALNVNDIGLSDLPDVMPNTVILGGFETELRGWRVGWMAGHNLHAKLRSTKQSMTICTPSVSQWAALAMLEAQS
ncbi:MAG: hypothetical protein AAGK74_06720 [Chloroflexota bacterium]